MTDAIRLLILDDDALTGQTILNIAALTGVDARYTDQPAEFFRLIQSWAPDFIALDLVMPSMDGVQVMVELARLQCPADIIISSGVGGRVLDAAARSASEHGLNIIGVLPKPFSPARLRQMLKRTPLTAPSLPTSLPLADIEQDKPPQIPVQALAEAIRNGDITVVYQPKINCRTSLLTGFEALARWHHPQLGSIPPTQFIPLAEQSGLIDALTESVVLQSLRWYAALPESLGSFIGSDYLRRRLREITLSVNISASSLGHLELFERLDDYCQSMGIRPDRVIFELTETCAMEDPVSSLDILTRLCMKGFRLSIDDFGTGYSSMLQLARLPFSEIKIDKSFVMTASESKESRTVIKAIIDLGHDLGLYTSAEGIEREETLEYLRSIGCDLAQGYAIAYPMTGGEVLQWLCGSPNDEARRLRVLKSLHILDTPPDQRFDRITRLATRLFQVPVALFTLVDADRQWFKSAIGLDIRETPRKVSFCHHAIQQSAPLVVPDAQLDPRFHDNELVIGQPHIRFYAGCPVHADSGVRLGTLCLIDHKPREFPPLQQRLLSHVARMVENELTEDYVAHIDPLTGLLNRRGFDERARDTIALCHAAGLHACQILLDLIDFKAFNKQHGPAAGDRALVEFSRVLCSTFRGSDLIARYGDDDFVVLLIDTVPPNPEPVLARLASAARASGSLYPMKYSAGWAALEKDDSFQQLILRASQHMRSPSPA